MLAGRVALVENNGNGFDESALADLSLAGFDCGRFVLDSTNPQELLSTGYTLLIAHLSPPLDSELVWMEALVALDEWFPVILLSRPDVLPSFGGLLQHASVHWLMTPCKTATLRNRATRAIHEAGLRALLGRAQTETRRPCSPLSIEGFVDQAFRNVKGTLLDIEHVTKAIAGDDQAREVCHLFDCPWRVSLADAVRDAIRVLEKTKSSFKSKELGELRHRLEAVLK